MTTFVEHGPLRTTLDPETGELLARPAAWILTSPRIVRAQENDRLYLYVHFVERGFRRDVWHWFLQPASAQMLLERVARVREAAQAHSAHYFDEKIVPWILRALDAHACDSMTLSYIEHADTDPDQRDPRSWSVRYTIERNIHAGVVGAEHATPAVGYRIGGDSFKSLHEEHPELARALWKMAVWSFGLTERCRALDLLLDALLHHAFAEQTQGQRPKPFAFRLRGQTWIGRPPSDSDNGFSRSGWTYEIIPDIVEPSLGGER